MRASGRKARCRKYPGNVRLVLIFGDHGHLTVGIMKPAVAVGTGADGLTGQYVAADNAPVMFFLGEHTVYYFSDGRTDACAHD